MSHILKFSHISENRLLNTEALETDRLRSVSQDWNPLVDADKIKWKRDVDKLSQERLLPKENGCETAAEAVNYRVLENHCRLYRFSRFNKRALRGII